MRISLFNCVRGVFFILTTSLLVEPSIRGENEAESFVSFIQEAFQCPDSNRCVQPDTSFAVKIETSRRCVFPGDSFEIAVTIKSPPYEIWGFDFLISFDSTLLALMEVIPGPSYFSDSGCAWEYFNYRYSNSINCGPSGCPGALVRVVGLADVNSPAVPSCWYVAKFSELFNLKFYLKNDDSFLYESTPIRFYWRNCGDNAISFKYYDDGYGSQNRLFAIGSRVFEGQNELESTDSFPTFSGPADSCFSDPNNHFYYVKRNIIDFINGSALVVSVCVDSIDDRGDVDLNGISFEMADIILFAKYFLFGNSIFAVNPAGQMFSTDINNDGEMLKLEELVQMILVQSGELRRDWIFDSTLHGLNFVVNDYRNKFIQLRSDQCANIVWLKFEGELIPHPAPHPHFVLHHFDGEYTNVLVLSLSGFDIRPDTLFGYSGDGNLIDLQAATLEGYEVALTPLGFTTDINDTDNPLPTDFALHQNYPNPFNNETVIRFELPRASNVEFEIINLLGQTVFRTDKRYSAGSHSISWAGVDQNGSIVGSGVYYYRIVAGDFAESKKMILLK